MTEPHKAERDAFEKRMLSDDFDWQKHHLIRGEDGEYTYLDLRNHWREFHAGFEAGRNAREPLRLAALAVLATMVKVQGSDVLVCVRAKDCVALAEAAGFRDEAALKEVRDAR